MLCCIKHEQHAVGNTGNDPKNYYIQHGSQDFKREVITKGKTTYSLRRRGGGIELTTTIIIVIMIKIIIIIAVAFCISHTLKLYLFTSETKRPLCLKVGQGVLRG